MQVVLLATEVAKVLYDYDLYICGLVLYSQWCE